MLTPDQQNAKEIMVERLLKLGEARRQLQILDASISACEDQAPCNALEATCKQIAVAMADVVVSYISDWNL